MSWNNHLHHKSWPHFWFFSDRIPRNRSAESNNGDSLKALIKWPSRMVVPIPMALWLSPALLGKTSGWVGGARSRSTPVCKSGYDQMVFLAAQHVGAGQEAAYTNLLCILWLWLWTTTEHTDIKSLLYFFFKIGSWDFHCMGEKRAVF